MKPCTSKSLTPVSVTPVLKKRVSHTVSFKIDVCDYFTPCAISLDELFHLTSVNLTSDIRHYFLGTFIIYFLISFV